MLLPKEPQLLEMALMGYQIRLEQIDFAMAQINRQLQMNGYTGRSLDTTRSTMAKASFAFATDEAQPKRTMSQAGRKRIAAAQKRRWKEHKRQQKLAARGK